MATIRVVVALGGGGMLIGGTAFFLLSWIVSNIYCR